MSDEDKKKDVDLNREFKTHADPKPKPKEAPRNELGPEGEMTIIYSPEPTPGGLGGRGPTKPPVAQSPADGGKGPSNPEAGESDADKLHFRKTGDREVNRHYSETHIAVPGNDQKHVAREAFASAKERGRAKAAFERAASGTGTKRGDLKAAWEKAQARSKNRSRGPGHGD